jgi:hypothetical protein
MKTQDLDILVSAEDNFYQSWQMWILALSLYKVGQPGRLVNSVSLVEADRIIHPMPGYIIPSKGYKLLGLSDYACWNKLLGMKAYLSHVKDDGPVAVIDPDFIFIRPLDQIPPRGTVWTNYHHHMEPTPGTEIILKRHLRCGRERFFAAGVPHILHRSDLARMIDRWYQANDDIRNDPETKDIVGWISEMWAYGIAAAESGLRQEYRPLAAGMNGPLQGEPMIHYCHDAPEWSKRTYKPWKAPPKPDSTTSPALRVVLEAVDAAARVFGNVQLL